MPIILKIGHDVFLVKTETAAFSAMKALCGAVKLSQGHMTVGGHYKEVYWRAKRQDEIAIQTISTNDLLAGDPGSDPIAEPPATKPKLLNAPK